jgi:hypothetical protein
LRSLLQVDDQRHRGSLRDLALRPGRTLGGISSPGMPGRRRPRLS